jgi:plastocyanin domain-containing protein
VIAAGPRRRRARLGWLLYSAWALTLAVCVSTSSAGDVPSATTTGMITPASGQRIAITARAGAFDPARVHLVQGVPAVLEFTRVVDSECMKALRMPWMEDAVDLPMNETVEIPVDTSMTGVFSYSCWMNMVFGEVVIDNSTSISP